MLLKDLQDRVMVVQAEFDKANSNVLLLTEQLQKSKDHVLMVTGHMNEANWALQEEVKALEALQVPADAIAPPIDAEFVDG